ncbi:2-oxoacid dehydrogenases acyltransferase-domain-containing protein [Podospora didyma]|uniref:Dihydrolipoamide acetyltransferase component of pyruvate dehydrogenase complex n=1 Tax=Podospora didyma TaxID=330526 RepID=A0AAE0P7C2_9PEZI|nr:2-oxoacid dehydrogenases acyltransferase-domain-containing protein [Podospora didyma]
MFLHHSSRAARQQQWRLYSGRLGRLATACCPPPASAASRAFHDSKSLRVVKPVLLADIGEGIVECEVIQWFVEPGARVEEFSPLCEVQSDKASVEITSRFAGVVKKLHFDAGQMAKVGKPFVDIDIEGDAKEEDLKVLTPPEPASKLESFGLKETPTPEPESETEPLEQGSALSGNATPISRPQKGTHAGLATPAVRHLTKELDVKLSDIDGTGRDGRVLKEDIYKFVERRNSASTQTPNPSAAAASSSFSLPELPTSGSQKETPLTMTRTQEMMFKTMTRSLNIPHFLYADEVDFTELVELRGRLNKVLAKAGMGDSQVGKLSYLPFIIKAVSMALYKYPILNARVDVEGSSGKPMLVLRSRHNIGVAMDTPSGLLVPVVKNVGNLNVLGIAAELGRLQSLAAAGKLSPQDMSGGTITVSNIGSIGGTYLSPVVVEREVAILGIGRMRTVPAFSSAPGEESKVVRRQVCNFSWSADHRVVDGATMARAADVVRTIVEEPDVMVMHLR